MFPCPHCGKGIQIESPADVPWYIYKSGGTQVSLGCGTLILIAIIVLIFSRGGDDSGAIRNLQSDIRSLEKKIDDIGLQLEAAQPAAANDNKP